MFIVNVNSNGYITKDKRIKSITCLLTSPFFSPRRKIPVCISISYNDPLPPCPFPSSWVLVNCLVPTCLSILVPCYWGQGSEGLEVGPSKEPPSAQVLLTHPPPEAAPEQSGVSVSTKTSQPVRMRDVSPLCFPNGCEESSHALGATMRTPVSKLPFIDACRIALGLLVLSSLMVFFLLGKII